MNLLKLNSFPIYPGKGNFILPIHYIYTSRYKNQYSCNSYHSQTNIYIYYISGHYNQAVFKTKIQITRIFR
jgi:hypothetical protein